MMPLVFEDEVGMREGFKVSRFKVSSAGAALISYKEYCVAIHWR
jgi:hypothetical protein